MNLFNNILLVLIVFTSLALDAQEYSTAEIKDVINTYKNDPRGPYHRIKWFCEDGSIRASKDPCPDEIDGIQHATFKKSALKLRESNHLFLGEILAAEKNSEFLDVSNNFNRLKQYQLGKYLASIDDGWILRKAQFYRGSVQSEDEQAWGRDFFKWLLKDNRFLENHYYLIRQALKDIPHRGESNIAQEIRSLSQIISEEHADFMDIRTKIHGNPEASDIYLVQNFYTSKKPRLSNKMKAKIKSLMEVMKSFYAPLDISKLQEEIGTISGDNEAVKQLRVFLEEDYSSEPAELQISKIANILYNIRTHTIELNKSSDRLKLLDISNNLEHYLFTIINKWKPLTLQQNIEKIETLTCVAGGTGLLEQWEFNTINSRFNDALAKEDFSIEELIKLLTNSRRAVEWALAMIKVHYKSVTHQYLRFEPLTKGFIDDKIRSSVALHLGETVSNLGQFVANVSNINNDVLGINNQGSIRGLNPGYAKGKLVVVEGNPDKIETSSDKIYIFEKPPVNLKPVAGIMSVSEGNLVSHVQLLARNLGIPNAVLSQENLKILKQHDGLKVFYAVSDRGRVLLKLKHEMTSQEKNLFAEAKNKKNKDLVTVPADVNLETTSVLKMSAVGASDSGKLCGPKAANLGELKNMFPEHVVDGVIVPFGVFKAHMNQRMKNENRTYWEYLKDLFNKADEMKATGQSNQVVEAFQVEALGKLQQAISNMSLKKSFITDLKAQFKSVFGHEIGKIPVFVRSDTNMEDLKNFTGAGLNLTLFNIKDETEILNGIKKVWASAYGERSFKWRQKYLSNPEQIFPSILIIPSVDVDYSGVMITTGINAGSTDDITVAVNKGAGGAVNGQIAETRLITKHSDCLLSPTRQLEYIRLPDSGGTEQFYTTFEKPILTTENIQDLRQLASKVKTKMNKNSDPNSKAYDVEFGFKNNKLWLFQIRPFVENTKAKKSKYLASIAPKVNSNIKVKITTPLQ